MRVPRAMLLLATLVSGCSSADLVERAARGDRDAAVELVESSAPSPAWRALSERTPADELRQYSDGDLVILAATNGAPTVFAALVTRVGEQSWVSLVAWLFDRDGELVRFRVLESTPGWGGEHGVGIMLGPFEVDGDRGLERGVAASQGVWVRRGDDLALAKRWERGATPR